jgi:hypothetical protein
VPHHAAVADLAVEQHAVEADEDPVADRHGPCTMERWAMELCRRWSRRRRTGVDHHAVLDVGVGADTIGCMSPVSSTSSARITA